jgi:hypothetical protein
MRETRAEDDDLHDERGNRLESLHCYGTGRGSHVAPDKAPSRNLRVAQMECLRVRGANRGIERMEVDIYWPCRELMVGGLSIPSPRAMSAAWR